MLLDGVERGVNMGSRRWSNTAMDDARQPHTDTDRRGFKISKEPNQFAF